MKTESFILLVIGIFFAIIGAIYWFTSYEQAGTLMLIGSALLGLLPGGYYYYWYRKMGQRPEDNPDATIASGAGVISSFPGSSIWPFVLASGAFFIGLTFVFGIWFAPVALALVVSALIGATVESRRGGHV
jgi:hypothetical protein